MATGVRAIDEARRRWERQRLDLGNELRTGRHIRNLTLRQLAASIGVSASQVCRRELGHARLSGEQRAIHAAAVGLRMSIKLWPVGGGIRDAAQARYIAAFVARVGRAWNVVLEAPVPIAGDLRAADVLLAAGSIRIAVEVVTRLADVQAQIRAAQLKTRDLGATRLIIVVAGTRANRAALADTRGALAGAFDLDTRRVMADLAAGRDPGRDAIVAL